MATFQKIKLGDLLEKKIKVEIKKGLEYSFVPMENVDSGSKYPRLVKTKIFNGSGSKFANSDTLFARITPCLQNKKIAKVKNLKNGIGFGSTEFFILRAKKDQADSDYLYYLTRLEDLINTAIISMTGASGRQRADIKSIYEFEVNVPDLSTQSRIASILSNYDDLIENNQKRIKTLEEMAQRLYTEWFVKLKFPGHEETTMVDSSTEYGVIPEGWSMKKLQEISDVISGYAFKSSDFQETGIPVIKIKNITSNNTVDIEDTDFVSPKILTEKLSKYILKDLDIIIAMTGATAGKIGRISANQMMLLNQRVAKIEPYIGYYSFVWGSVETEDAQRKFYNLAGGAAQPNMSAKQIEEVKILVPTKDLLVKYENIASNFLKAINQAQKINSILAKQRDLLIPQLVTGKRKLNTA